MRASRKVIPADSLFQLRQRLDRLPPKSPERAAQVAAVAQLYGVSSTTVYRALKAFPKPRAAHRTNRGTSRVLPRTELEHGSVLDVEMATFIAAIPHRAPDLDVFLAIEPRRPLAQEFEQVPVLIGPMQDHKSLAWNVEHMNPHEGVEDPACGRVLHASAFLVREGRPRVLQRSADAVLSGRLEHRSSIF
jgi:hypothetical protein